ncbi:hypothetical protein G6F40_016353 [Rhizopus arrhizus]|nr:hypothetical protein G6F40_016353 [Rhizopus arrhizus]
MRSRNASQLCCPPGARDETGAPMRGSAFHCGSSVSSSNALPTPVAASGMRWPTRERISSPFLPGIFSRYSTSSLSRTARWMVSPVSSARLSRYGRASVAIGNASRA